MTNYRAILEYHYKGNTTTQVARICECSRTTVLKTIKRAKECGLTQSSVAGMNDFKLLCKLYPNRVQRAEYTYPDFEASGSVFQKLRMRNRHAYGYADCSQPHYRKRRRSAYR